MIKYVSFICTLLISLSALGYSYDDDLYGPYAAEYVATIDGDTVDLILHIYPGQTVAVRVRERSVDTPELRKSPDCEKVVARRATEFTRSLMEAAKEITVDAVGYGTFQPRMVGIMYVDDKPLGSLLKQAGYAVDYDKRDNKNWC